MPNGCKANWNRPRGSLSHCGEGWPAHVPEGADHAVRPEDHPPDRGGCHRRGHVGDEEERAEDADAAQVPAQQQRGEQGEDDTDRHGQDGVPDRRDQRLMKVGVLQDHRIVGQGKEGAAYDLPVEQTDVEGKPDSKEVKNGDDHDGGEQKEIGERRGPPVATPPGR